MSPCRRPVGRYAARTPRNERGRPHGRVPDQDSPDRPETVGHPARRGQAGVHRRLPVLPADAGRGADRDSGRDPRGRRLLQGPQQHALGLRPREALHPPDARRVQGALRQPDPDRAGGAERAPPLGPRRLAPARHGLWAWPDRPPRRDDDRRPGVRLQHRPGPGAERHRVGGTVRHERPAPLQGRRTTTTLSTTTTRPSTGASPSRRSGRSSRRRSSTPTPARCTGC